MSYPLFLAKLLIRSGLARLIPAGQRLTDGGAAFLRYYSDRVLAAPYLELRQAAGLFEPAAHDVIDLSRGIPSFDLVASSSTKLAADRRGWPPPWGLSALRQAAAEKMRAEHHLTFNPADEVLITQGIAGAFSTVLDTFVNPGDYIVLFDPTSPLYHFVARQRRARIRWIPTWMEAGRTRFHLEPLVKALRGARLMITNSPANPTGGVIAAEDLEQIAWWADRRDVLIFDDRAFERFRYEGDSVLIGTLAKACRRTLTAGSVSQGYALAWARVGWLAGHRHLIRPCAMTAALQASLVPTLCQQIGLTALGQSEELFQPILRAFASRRHYASERLQALGLKPAWPAGAFFFWLPVHECGLNAQQFAELLLRRKKVAVTPGDLFGPSGPGHVRLSYATEDGRLREGLSRLAEFVRDCRPGLHRQAA